MLLSVFSVCKCKAHKRCAVRASNNCKWTTLASIGKDIIEEDDGVNTGNIFLFGIDQTILKHCSIYGWIIMDGQSYTSHEHVQLYI